MDNTSENQSNREKKYRYPRIYQGFSRENWKNAFRKSAKFSKKSFQVVSTIIDILVIIVLIILVQQNIILRNFIASDILAQLYQQFVDMNKAVISTDVKVKDTIFVKDSIAINFDLPLEQPTEVILIEDTPIKNATIILNNQLVPLDLTLKAGTPLNINLDLVVPVSQTIPIELAVPVDLDVPVSIPISTTQLSVPFEGLQKIVSTYALALHSDESRPCQGKIYQPICDWFFVTE